MYSGGKIGILFGNPGAQEGADESHNENLDVFT